MTDQERKVMEMALDALEELRKDVTGNGAPEHWDAYYAKQGDALDALLQALAQDEQEPVIDRRLKVKIGRQYGYALNEHWFYLQPADEYAEQALTKHSGISVPPKREWQALVQPEPQVCCGDYEKCMKACTPRGRWLVERELAQPEQEPTLTEKDGSPCPEFWDWLPKAYNFEGLGEFTKYNMEVAFLAGKNTALAQPEQEPVAYMHTCGSDIQINTLPAHCYGNNWTRTPLYTAPPSKPWVSLTDEEIKQMYLSFTLTNNHSEPSRLVRSIEAKLKEKNT